MSGVDGAELAAGATQVYVVDDDPAVLESVAMLMRSVNQPVRTFSSAQQFLEGVGRDAIACLLLDVRMPGASGLEVHSEMQRRGISMPVIFMTGYGDVPIAVKTMRAGAVDFIEKPFNPQDLVDRVQECLRISTRLHDNQEKIRVAQAALARLSPREKEVARLIVGGQHTKRIAAKFGISEKTVAVHRFNILKKTGCPSLADLVRVWRIAEPGES
jgi:FixJ family two-component response regulator